MQWPAWMIANGRRMSAERAYLHARLQVSRLDTPERAHWWGLFALLSRHYLRHGQLRPIPEIWGELWPFLLISEDRAAEWAVLEYLVYLNEPRLADLQWLGIQLNEALVQAEVWNDAVGDVLDQPALALSAPWMALLSFPSLLRLRRAATFYGSEAARRRRRSYWHALPAFHDTLSPIPGPRLAMMMADDQGEAFVRRRRRFDPDLVLAARRRFSPVMPASLS